MHRRCAGTELLQRLLARWQQEGVHGHHPTPAAAAAAAAASSPNGGADTSVVLGAPAREGAAAAGEHAHDEGHGHAPGPLPMFTSCCPAWINLVEKASLVVLGALGVCWLQKGRAPSMLPG